MFLSIIFMAQIAKDVSARFAAVPVFFYLISFIISFCPGKLVADESLRKAPSGNPTLIIKSNAPSAVVAVDGIVAGKVGERLEVSQSSVSITLSAPGFVTRELTLVLPAKDKNLFQINLAEETKLVDSKISIPVAADSPKWQAKSLAWIECISDSQDAACQDINAMAKSLEEQSAATLLYRKELTEAGPDGLAKAEQQNEQALIKSFYLNPFDGAAHEQLARFQFYQRRDCMAVNQIVKSAQLHHLVSEELSLLQGICFEMIEGQEAASRFYAKMLPNFKSSIDLYWRWFHQGGGGWDIEFSQEKKKKCAAMFPTFIPCFTDQKGPATHDVALGLKVSAQLRKSKQLPPLVKQIMADLQDKNIEKAIKIARQQLLPNRFVLEVLALALTDASIKEIKLMETHFIPLIRRAFPLDLINVERILSLAEQRLPPMVLTEVYRRLLVLKPNDVRLQFKAAQVAGNLERYDDALLFLQNIPQDYQPGRNLRAQVLVRLNRLNEAEIDYKWLADKNSQSWQARYNLAVIYEKQGKHSEFVALASQILKMQPPENVAKTLKERSDYYQKKLNKKPINAR